MFLWEPFANLYSDAIIVKIIIFFLVFTLIDTVNSYKILFVIFLQSLFIGIYLSVLNIDVMVGFLWVLELTIIFCAVIILFHFNSDISNKNFSKTPKFNKFALLCAALFSALIYNSSSLNGNFSSVFSTMTREMTFMRASM